MRRRHLPDLAQRGLEVADLGPADAHHLDRRLMQVRHGGPRALLDHDGLEVAEHGVLGRRRDALIGEHARHQHRLRAQSPQHHLQVGAVEGAEPRLRHVPVLRLGLQIGQDLPAPGLAPQAAVLEEGPELHERPAVFCAPDAVAGPDDGDVLGRAAASSAFIGSMQRCMWPMSMPCVAYQPSACRKSFCASMTTSAVRPGTRSQCAASKGDACVSSSVMACFSTASAPSVRGT